MKSPFAKLVAVFALALASLQAHGFDWSDKDVHVTAINVSVMGTPGTGTDAGAAILFMIDATWGSCTAGTNWMFWVPIGFTDGTTPVPNDKQMVNANAVLSTLQIALTSGNKVRLSGFNNSAGYCQVGSVTLLNTY